MHFNQLNPVIELLGMLGVEPPQLTF